MLQKEYVLVFPSWYPSRVNEFNGDFNQRTIEALSSKFHQVVIYLTADKSVKKLEIQRNENNQVTTVIGYYPKSRFRWFSFLRYFFNYLKITHLEIKKLGKPLYVHTYVFFPVGLISLYFSRKLKVKNVLTEHWSVLYPDNEFSLTKNSLLYQAVCKWILRSFRLILPVTKTLETAIDYWAPSAEKIIIPNVVNTAFFKISHENNFEKFTFLHVSSMESHKNPEGILKALELVCHSNKYVSLKMVGPINSKLKEIVNGSTILKNGVDFVGEISNYEVAKMMQKSHCLIMNSLYESLPCVILEALCCGLPVISTDVGGIHEVINDDNGILLKDKDLKDAMIFMLSNQHLFDRQLISERATQKYNYEAISNKTWKILEDKGILNKI